jgi:lipoate-protein ligase A
MRPTGGKAVLHGHDLTVSLAIPLTELAPGSRNVRQIYRCLIQPIVAGLRSVGVPAALGEDSPESQARSTAADCFVQLSPNDVIHEATRAKIVGCALRVTRTAALAQCSIPIGEPLVDPATVFESAHTPHKLDIDIVELARSIEREWRLTSCCA